MLGEIRNELETREADNDKCHEATLTLLAANLERAEGRIEGERARAAESHDQQGVHEAEEKLKRAKDVFEKEVTIEGQRYDTERAAIDKELNALDEMAKRHESERAALESLYAPDIEPEGPRAPGTPELDNRDPVEGVIDWGVRAGAALANFPSQDGPPVDLDNTSQDVIAESLKMTWRDWKTKVPDDVQHLFPLSPLERELRVQESARRPESVEGHLLADREFVHQQQQQALQERQREELERKLGEQKRDREDRSR